MTENQSRAEAKAADPAGSKRAPSKIAEGTQRPVKAKMAEPTGEKRKADSDAEEELQGSPMRSRVEEDEVMINRLSRVTTFEVLQLHAGSSLTRDSEKHGIDTMDLGAWILINWRTERGSQLGCEKGNQHLSWAALSAKRRNTFHGVAVYTSCKQKKGGCLYMSKRWEPQLGN